MQENQKQTIENDDDNVRLLKMMVSRLKERSHIQQTYVSISCNCKDPMVRRIRRAWS